MSVNLVCWMPEIFDQRCFAEFSIARVKVQSNEKEGTERFVKLHTSHGFSNYRTRVKSETNIEVFFHLSKKNSLLFLTHKVPKESCCTNLLGNEQNLAD